MKSLCKNLVLIHSFLMLASCTGIVNTQYYEYLTTNVEPAMCIDNYAYRSGIRLGGVAKFFKRGVEPIVGANSTTNEPELKNLILSDPLQEALPIRYAEIVVLNSNRQIVQCGRTDSDGNLKAVDSVSDLLLPPTPGNYTVQVLSRVYVAFDSIALKPVFNLDAAIKKDKYTNKLYTLENVVFSNGIDEPNTELIAYARQTESDEINGGAFNILNDIFLAYSYLNGSTSSTVDLQCLSDRVNVYWKAGFNPLQYELPNEDPDSLDSVSYYTHAGDRSLYISGGKLGNTSIADTDHFDDYVIVHELGHYIEDHCGHLTSRGGAHSLSTRIEPRLAWTEAWANYFAAQVMFNDITLFNPEFPLKMDAQGLSSLDQEWSYLSTTFGFSDSSLNVGNGDGVAFDLKKPGNNPDSFQSGSMAGFAFDKVDPTRFPGEGHFREGAITRGLFKLTSPCGSNCAASTMPFERVWIAAMNTTTGVGKPSIKFKSSYDIFFRLDSLGLAGWNSIGGNGLNEYQEVLEGEALQLASDSPNPYLETVSSEPTWVPYAKPLTSISFSACATKQRIQPRVDDPTLTGVQSDQRYSNHYYLIDLGVLSGLDTLSVKFTRNAGTVTDFDVILYEENYFYESDYGCQVTSTSDCQKYPKRNIELDMVRADRTTGTTFKKLTRLQDLDQTKKYLLNIRAYTAAKSISATTDYSYEFRDGLVVNDGMYICQ